jgi:DedD protein
MEEVQQAHLTAWAVQLASFPKPDKALTLRDRLRKRGYPAFVTSAAEEPSAAARVLVGPALFEEKAQEIASKLERDLHLKGVVVQYPPN